MSTNYDIDDEFFSESVSTENLPEDADVCKKLALDNIIADITKQIREAAKHKLLTDIQLNLEYTDHNRYTAWVITHYERSEDGTA